MSTSKHSDEHVWAREREFHDALAGDIDVDALAHERQPGRLELALLDLAGVVSGRTILDAGCGQGDLTLHLLQQGATVTALDVSPGMIDVVRRRAQRLSHDPGALTTVAAPLERSDLPDAGFDLVLGKFILHHVDVDAGAIELRRVLRPGGRAIFIENVGNNALLRFARDRLAGRWGIPRLGTEDEHPLTGRDIDNLRGVFTRVTAHYPVFEFLVLFDRQVLRFRFPAASRVIRGLDDAVHRLAPRLRRFSYRVIVELEVASATQRTPQAQRRA
jgi:SAM-dependent methyltransferase